jgi:hypothetical protein
VSNINVIRFKYTLEGRAHCPNSRCTVCTMGQRKDDSHHASRLATTAALFDRGWHWIPQLAAAPSKRSEFGSDVISFRASQSRANALHIEARAMSSKQQTRRSTWTSGHVLHRVRVSYNSILHTDTAKHLWNLEYQATMSSTRS